MWAVSTVAGVVARRWHTGVTGQGSGAMPNRDVPVMTGARRRCAIRVDTKERHVVRGSD